MEATADFEKTYEKQPDLRVVDHVRDAYLDLDVERELGRFETGYEGFDPNQKRGLEMLQDILGFGSPRTIRKIPDFQIDGNNVAGFFDPNSRDLCLTNMTMSIATHPKEMVAIAIHELVHGGSASLNPTVFQETVYKRMRLSQSSGFHIGFEEAASIQIDLMINSEYALERLTEVLLSSGKYLNGYHRYVTERYLEGVQDPVKAAQNQYGLVDKASLQHEVLAITLETAITDPKKLESLSEAIAKHYEAIGEDFDFMEHVNSIIAGLTSHVSNPDEVPAYLQLIRASIPEIVRTIYGEDNVFESWNERNEGYNGLGISHIPPTQVEIITQIAQIENIQIADLDLIGIIMEILKKTKNKKQNLFELNKILAEFNLDSIQKKEILQWFTNRDFGEIFVEA